MHLAQVVILLLKLAIPIKSTCHSMEKSRENLEGKKHLQIPERGEFAMINVSFES